MAALKAAKKELRTIMKSRLAAISTSKLASQSTQLHKTLSALPPYTAARRISIYLSMPSGEIQTDAIVHSALTDGKQVFIPYLHSNADAGEGSPKRIMDMVALKGLEDYESLGRDAWGIPSVGEDDLDQRERILGSDYAGLDLMLLPGVAFQRQEEGGGVRRLGHGRGFYDYFLQRYALRHEKASDGSTRKLKLYGLALEEQFLRHEDMVVPVGPLDHTLDGVLVAGHIIDECGSP